MAKKKATRAAAKSDAATEAASEPDLSFEQSIERLHAIVAELEGGEISLEDSLARYEQGMKLVAACHKTLTGAEQRIRQLTGFSDDGSAETAPFDGTATVDQVSGAGRRDAASLFE